MKTSKSKAKTLGKKTLKKTKGGTTHSSIAFDGTSRAVAPGAVWKGRR